MYMEGDISSVQQGDAHQTSIIQVQEEDEEEVKEDVELDDNHGLGYNIQQVSKDRDLCPWNIGSLNIKKDTSNVPLQVQTRSSKGRSVSNDQ